MEQMLQIIGEIAREVLRLPELAAPDMDLAAAGLDSLRMVELLVAVEQRFELQVPESMLDASAFASVRKIAALIDAVRSSHDMPEAPGANS